MLNCWHSEPEARMNFTQLKYSFQSMISASTTATGYISIQPEATTARKTHLSSCSEDMSTHTEEA